jgi:hypothetical protein
MTESASVGASNELQLANVSRQLGRISQAVAEDVADNRDNASGKPGGGFVAYTLKDLNGEPLKHCDLDTPEITLGAVQATTGFATLRERCERLQLKVRVDHHFYADTPRPTRIFRVIIDGWPG